MGEGRVCLMCAFVCDNCARACVCVHACACVRVCVHMSAFMCTSARRPTLILPSSRTSVAVSPNLQCAGMRVSSSRNVRAGTVCT